MRQHFHRCGHLRILSVDAEELSGDRKGGSVVLDELCEARNLGRCVGLAECDVLPSAQKRELLVARLTRLREEEGGETALGELGDERGRALLELAGELREERAAILMENRRLLAEEAAAEDASEQLAAPSDEAEFAALGVSMRWDEQLQRLQAGRLDAIDRALGEMAGARYGVCARCRGVIAIDRLRHSPDTRVCGECAGRSLTVS